jgi:hypothetical protein
VARFTSEPFSSVLITRTDSCPRPGTGTRGIVISCLINLLPHRLSAIARILPAYQHEPVRLFSGCDSAAGAPATMQEPFPGCEQHLICQQPDRHDDHHDPR